MIDQDLKLEYSEELKKSVEEILIETETKLNEINAKVNIGAPRPRP